MPVKKELPITRQKAATNTLNDMPEPRWIDANGAAKDALSAIVNFSRRENAQGNRMKGCGGSRCAEPREEDTRGQGLIARNRVDRRSGASRPA